MEHDREDVRLLAWQLGRIEEIVRESRTVTEKAIERMDSRLTDHERRLTVLETSATADGSNSDRIVRIVLAAFGVIGTALGIIGTLPG